MPQLVDLRIGSPHRRAFLFGAASLLALAGRAQAGTIAYTYDELGRLRTATYPDGSVETFNYDAAGNRTTYVTTGPDVTPAAVNWANISGASGATNAAQTISGISTPITLTVTYTGGGSLLYSKNSGAYTAIPTSGTVSMASGDTLAFKATGNASGTATVTNTSDGGATLDTFTYAVTADVTPATVNWADISGSSGATNAAQTISGIDTAITLTVTYGGTGSIQYSKNSGSYTSISNGGTVSVSASDTLSFKATVGSGSASGTVTVANTSDGGATLDTFTYSVSVVDVTPNAVDWGNISGSSGATNSAQTISGINTAITLTITYGGTGTIQYSKNSGTYTTVSNGGTISVSASDTLSFKATIGSGSASGTVTVTNTSDGSATLDTFTYSVTAASDVTPDAVNWSNISNFDGSFPYTPNGYTSTENITGINTAITLRVEESNNYNSGSTVFKYSINGGTEVTLTGASKTFSISNGQNVRFHISDVTTVSGTVSVYNNSDGNALLDTFTYALSTGE